MEGNLTRYARRKLPPLQSWASSTIGPVGPTWQDLPKHPSHPVYPRRRWGPCCQPVFQSMCMLINSMHDWHARSPMLQSRSMTGSTCGRRWSSLAGAWAKRTPTPLWGACLSRMARCVACKAHSHCGLKYMRSGCAMQALSWQTLPVCLPFAGVERWAPGPAGQFVAL